MDSKCRLEVSQGFSAVSAEQLSVKRGEKLRVESLWFRVRNSEGYVGLIPADCLKKKKGSTSSIASSLLDPYEILRDGVASPPLRDNDHDYERLEIAAESETAVTGFEPGTEVQAVHDFGGERAEDLSFFSGETLVIEKHTSDKNWCVAHRLDGIKGLIPAMYVEPIREVKLIPMPWFHGQITREKAEELLQPKKEGYFLIRDSKNHNGDFSLSLHCQRTVEHYHVRYKDYKYSVSVEEDFNSLKEMIERYQSGDGLCCRLTKPIKKTDQYHFSSDRQALADQAWILDMAHIQVTDLLGPGSGSGSSGVLKGEYKGSPVTLDLAIGDKKHIKQILNVTAIMTGLHHKNLVQLKGIVTQEKGVCLVTEYMAGSLVDHLRNNFGKDLITEAEQLNYARDVCCGMTYLETKGIVHRNLAARNVLLDSRGLAKVSGFSMCRYAKADQKGEMFRIRWTAPEAMREEKFSTKSDVWSFGVLLWEIFSMGILPYHKLTNTQVVHKVEAGNRLESPDGCSPEVYWIMQQAWKKVSKSRPSFRDLTDHLLNIQLQVGPRMRTTRTLSTVSAATTSSSEDDPVDIAHLRRVLEISTETHDVS